MVDYLMPKYDEFDEKDDEDEGDGDGEDEEQDF